jgi:DNA (cytosine-5)-methyltransferase 1
VTAKSQWVWRRPATTVCADPRIGHPGHRDRAGGESQFENDAVRITLEEGLILQSFDPGYPIQGNRSQAWTQVGNAVPPLLAAAVVAALTERTD